MRTGDRKLWPMGQIWRMPAFVDKALLGHSRTCLFRYCFIIFSYFHATVVELNSCDRNHVVHKAKNI